MILKLYIIYFRTGNKAKSIPFVTKNLNKERAIKELNRRYTIVGKPPMIDEIIECRKYKRVK